MFCTKCGGENKPETKFCIHCGTPMYQIPAPVQEPAPVPPVDVYTSAPVVLLIRRLTPLECERLQGFPDYWTKIPGASDSARYKAIGNSVAIPCVDYVINGMAVVLRNQNKQHKEKITYENTNCMQNFGSDTPVLYPAEAGQ